MNEKRLMTGKTVAIIAAISFISGMLGAVIFTRTSQAINPNIQTQVVQEKHYVEESDTISAIQKVVPAVVSIVATKDLQIFQSQPLDPFFFFQQDPFFRDFGFQVPKQQQQKQQQPETKREKIAGGTGFIIDENGFAVTNRHVVADTGADYTALTKDGKEYDVEVISRDTVNDLSVIQLHEKTVDSKDRKTGEKKNFGAKPKDLPIVKLGDSSQLKVGQRVLAIGNARGEYQNSVTSGIISAIGRQIEASDQGGSAPQTLSGLIQTDAAINFGNSGGPLVNLNGEVIGINTAIDASGTSIGFAIPANQIKPVLISVNKFGRIVRPILGVAYMTLTKDKAIELKLEGLDHGALIVGDRSKKEFGVVAGSPAEKAGLKMDDVILEVDGEQITEQNSLQTIVQNHAPGDKLKLKVWRDGKTFDVTVTLDEKKE